MITSHAMVRKGLHCSVDHKLCKPRVPAPSSTATDAHSSLSLSLFLPRTLSFSFCRDVTVASQSTEAWPGSVPRVTALV